MSGGSMDYLYTKVKDASFRKHTPLRRAFRKHLDAVAGALRAIEWNDSGDGDDKEEVLIRKVLAPGVELAHLVGEARIAVRHLNEALDRAMKGET